MLPKRDSFFSSHYLATFDVLLVQYCIVLYLNIFMKYSDIEMILSLFGGEKEMRIGLEFFPDCRQLIKHLTVYHYFAGKKFELKLRDVKNINIWIFNLTILVSTTVCLIALVY